MRYWLLIFISVLANEALVELLKSGFFEPVRDYFSKQDNRFCSFLYKIMVCGYCGSVWTAASLTVLIFIAFAPVFTGCLFLDAFFFFILTHRISNRIHDIGDRYLNKDVLEINKE